MRLLQAALLVLCVLTALTWAQIPAPVRFVLLDRSVVEARLKSYVAKNSDREIIIKGLFAGSGCKDTELSEQVVNKRLPPNVICVLPGDTDEEILVGAHFDHADIGEGVVDNWSGASLLPSLFASLSAVRRRHTYVFVAFTAEELGMLGSDHYAHKLTREQRAKIEAMVNLDTLGLGPTEVWGTHSDKKLLQALGITAGVLHLPVSVMNVDGVGTTDSESFSNYKIPRITLHSVTTETLRILHSEKDDLTAIKLDDYYNTYHLIAAYLAYLDSDLGRPAPDVARTSRK